MQRSPQTEYDGQRIRSRTYYASMTTERKLVLLGLGLLATLFIGSGYLLNRQDPHAGWGLMLCGLAVLGLPAPFFARTLRRWVRVGGEAITYCDGSRTIEIPWKDLQEFKADPRGWRLFRTALVSGAGRSFRVDSYTFPDYDQIVSLVEVALKHHWTGSRRRGP
jgi:hypothetical protein